MPLSKRALDFAEFCDNQNDASVIGDRFVQTLQAFGYAHIACSSHVDPLHPRRGAVSIVTYPMAWQQQYSHGEYAFIDPVFLLACAMPSYFYWDDYLARMRLNRRQQRMLVEGADYGLVRGLTIPLKTPDVMPASCTLIAGRAGIDPLYIADALFVVSYGHGAMHRRLNPNVMLDPVLLPARERQCLALAGCGKSDWVIGKLLGISERTVHNCLERAKKRYRASHRLQAVVRAAFDGQITLDDLAP